MKYVKHHTSKTKGYVPKWMTEGIKKPYSGIFGRGYTIDNYNPKSTWYCLRTYYIEAE